MALCLFISAISEKRDRKDVLVYYNSAELAIFKNGVKCKIDTGAGKIGGGSPRSEITIFSRKSRNRLSWIYSQGDWKSMITLTYHNSFPDYQVSKGHLHAVLDRLTKNGIKYLWVVEFQSRGFPHYHVWLSKSLDGDEWRDYMKTWLNVTKEHNGDEKAINFHMHDASYTEWDVRFDLNYAVKYAQKQKQKGLPVGVKKFGRWWGSSRNIIIPERVFTSTLFEETAENRLLAKTHIRIRRTIKNAVFHWCKRKKRNSFDRRTMSGFTFIFNDERKKYIDRIVDFEMNEYRRELELRGGL